MSAAVQEVLAEEKFDMPVSCLKCSGAAECKKALMLLKMGRLPADFIEGMACEGGCVGGPSSHMAIVGFQKERNAQIAQADDRGIHENLAHYDSVVMH